MSDLFSIEESKSPRLLWMERHGVTVRRYRPDEFDYLAGQDFAWMASNGTETAQGDTEDEAITQLALKLGIRLWNEGGQP